MKPQRPQGKDFSSFCVWDTQKGAVWRSIVGSLLKILGCDLIQREILYTAIFLRASLLFVRCYIWDEFHRQFTRKSTRVSGSQDSFHLIHWSFGKCDESCLLFPISYSLVLKTGHPVRKGSQLPLTLGLCWQTSQSTAGHYQVLSSDCSSKSCIERNTKEQTRATQPSLSSTYPPTSFSTDFWD